MENMCKVIITIMTIAFISIILGFFSANLYENDPIWNDAITLISFMMAIFAIIATMISKILETIENKSNKDDYNKKEIISVLKFNFHFSLILICTSFASTIAISYVKSPMYCIADSHVFNVAYDSLIIFIIGILFEIIWDCINASLNLFNNPQK